MAVWLLATASYAEEPSFPRPIEDDETLKLQYVIQFYEAPPSTESILSEANGIKEIIRKIPTRKILVVRFSSKKAAEKWKSNTRGIKYFLQGEKKIVFTLDYLSGYFYLKDGIHYYYRLYGLPR